MMFLAWSRRGRTWPPAIVNPKMSETYYKHDDKQKRGEEEQRKRGVREGGHVSQ